MQVNIIFFCVWCKSAIAWSNRQLILLLADFVANLNYK